MAAVIGERGNESSADEPMYIHMYPNTSAKDDECENAIGTRMENICDELFDVSSIDYYKIVVRYDHPDVSHADSSDFFSSFDNWIAEQTNYGGEKGAHLGGAGGFTGGLADSGDGFGQTSFSTGNTCVVGTLDVKEFYSNLAIQEVLHTFIYHELVDDDLTKSGDTEHEHDLGHVYSDHSSSPMITSYEGDHTEHGQCDNAPGFLGYYTASLTSCTKEAVKITADQDT